MLMDHRPSATLANQNDAALLTELRQGREEAFEKLVRSQGGRLLATARRIVGNEEDAREAVQDAFLSAFKALPEFSGQSQLSTWLHRILINAALQKLRRRQRKPERLIDDLLPKFLNDGHQADPADVWREPSEVVLQRQETLQLVRQAIDQLPENYRTVLMLRDIEGLDTEETARTLGVTIPVVKTRLHRARQALRTLLDSHFRGGAL